MAVIGKAGLDRGVENPIDRLQNRRRGAEGIGKTAALEKLPGLTDLLFECRAFAVQLFGVRALERVDRLLLVAHDEEGAIHLVTRPGAGVKFICQPFDHVPLPGRGVLRLVDKDMVDAAVDAEQHPSSHGLVGQQSAGFEDQIVKVEPAAFLFLIRVAFKKAGRETVEHIGFARRLQRQPRFAGIFDALHQLLKLRHLFGDDLLRRLGRETADLGGEGRLGAAAGQKDVFKLGQGGQIIAVNLLQRRARLAVIAAFGQQMGDDLGHHRRFAAKEDRGRDLVFGQVFGLGEKR